MNYNGGGGVDVGMGGGGGVVDGLDVSGGGVITPLNPSQGQYGPAFWSDSLMMRKDDKPARSTDIGVCGFQFGAFQMSNTDVTQNAFQVCIPGTVWPSDSLVVAPGFGRGV